MRPASPLQQPPESVDEKIAREQRAAAYFASSNATVNPKTKLKSRNSFLGYFERYGIAAWAVTIALPILLFGTMLGVSISHKDSGKTIPLPSFESDSQTDDSIYPQAFNPDTAELSPESNDTTNNSTKAQTKDASAPAVTAKPTQTKPKPAPKPKKRSAPKAPVKTPTKPRVKPAPAISNFTIASWNTLYSNKKSVGTSAAQLAKTADIIGMQELHHNDQRAKVKSKMLCSSCSFNGYLDAHGVRGSSPASVPIIWNKSKFKLAGSGYTQVSKKTPIHDKKNAYISAKWIVWVRLKDLKTGKYFYVLNTHTVASVESGGKPGNSKVRQSLYKKHMSTLKSLITNLKSSHLPIFITGDFNVNYRKDKKVQYANFPYVAMRSVGVRSNWELLNLKGVPSNKGSYPGNDRIIDYVFEYVRNDVSPRSIRIGSTTLGSDHYPVFYSLTLTR